MRRIFVLGLTSCLALPLPASALELVSSDPISGLPPRIEIVSRTTGGMHLTFDLPALATEDVVQEGRTFRSVSIPGGGLEGAPGEAARPTFTRLLAVPNGMTARVRAEVLAERTLSGFDLAPVPPDGDRARADGRAIERLDTDRDDSALVTVGSPAILRDLRVVPITFRPTRWDEATRTMRVAERLDVDVELVPDGSVPDRPTPQPSIPPTFERLYRELVIGWEAGPRAADIVPGTYLVIAPNDLAVTTQLQPLLQWRERTGTPVLLATTAQTGTTASAIRNYIQGVYDDPDVSLEYVVLVGDASGTVAIPTFYESLSGYGGEGDLPYSRLAGADILPDVHVGRLSVDSATTLSYVVAKILGYEKTPELSDPAWYGRSCIVGDPTSSGLSCVETGRWLAERLAEFGHTDTDTIFSGSWVSQMQTALNRGDSVFGYRGWLGMSGWSNGYTSVLTNGWKMPYAVIITCDTGSFDSGTARTEGFLRAWDTTNARPRGAIGAIGMATTGTHTRYNNCLYYGIFRGLLQEGQTTMGAARTRGALELWLNYGMAQPSTVEYWTHWANLMGDPAVDVRTSYPDPLAVAHPSALAIGANSVALTVTEGAEPAAGALVCLSKDPEVWVVGTTDDLGAIELPVSLGTAGDLLLTVTRHGNAPYLATVPVATQTSWVGYAASTVDDDLSGESSGNGDGVANPGETIELAVQVRNSGMQVESGLVATLTSADPYVTIVDGTETYGLLAVGGTMWSPDDFDFTIAPGCPDGRVLVFGLAISGTGGTWHSRIELPVTAPDLVAVGTTVVDGGNGRLDPGETAQVRVALRNDGGIGATGVTGTLIAAGQFASVVDSLGTYGTIGTGATVDNAGDPFTVSIDPGTYEGYLAAFRLVTTFDGGTDTTEVLLTVGSRTSDDPVGPDAYGYLAYDDTDVAYPDAPASAWIEIDPALGGDGTLVGLSDNGTYQDDSRVVTLPFAFSYYGETFTEATICSNGWVALGATNLVSYRNWTIPGAGGPSAMIAPYWDNLWQDTSSRVVQKHDVANHRWIVEWSRMRNDYDNSIQTFEAVLYDPAYHATDTGDGLIVFRYQTVSNPDGTNGRTTVGIESPDQLDGLLYTYFAQYSAGAAPLVAGRAIRFVPTRPGPSGTLAGATRNASHGNTPIDGVQIEVLGAGRTFESALDGTYGGLVPPGTYAVVASHVSFAPDTVAGVSVVESQVTTQDFQLVDVAGPILDTTPHPWTEDTTGPYPIPVKIQEWSGLAEATLHWAVDGAAWNRSPLLPQGGIDYLASIPGQAEGSIVRYYVTALDSIGLSSTDPPPGKDAPYAFAVSRVDTLIADSFEAESGWTAGVPGDDATTGLWLRADPVGTEYNGSTVQPEDDHTPAPGVACFVTGNGAVGGSAGDQDVDGGKTTLLSPLYDLGAHATATVSYWVWYSNDLGNGPGEDAWLAQVSANGTDWVDLENTNASTGEAWVQRSFVLDDFVPGAAQVQFRFVASDLGVGSLVEAAIDDFLITGMVDTFTDVDPGDADLVLANGLAPGRPNPFRDGTRMSFAIVSPTRVSLRIYDVAGRHVATLVDGPLAAGRHAAVWDGRTAAGGRAASGVYFARLTTGDGFTQVRRITRLR